MVHFAEEHVQRADEIAVFTIQGLIDDVGLTRFGIVGYIEDAVHMVLEMAPRFAGLGQVAAEDKGCELRKG